MTRRTQLAEAEEALAEIRIITRQLDRERARVYIREETIRSDYGTILALCAKVLGEDEDDARRAGREE